VLDVAPGGRAARTISASNCSGLAPIAIAAANGVPNLRPDRDARALILKAADEEHCQEDMISIPFSGYQ
jgi:hypothetical protein